jgi:Kdo2-lipid IVA lauroyltransferase/acyltransferase
MAVVAGREVAPVAPRRSRRLRERPRSPALDWIGYGAVRAAVGALGALPLGWAMRIVELFALLAYVFDRPHRRVGMRNLEIAFPEKSLAERRRILRGSFLNLGRTVAELAHLPRLGVAELRDMVRFDDEAVWSDLMRRAPETGCIIMSGHFGNWELLAFANGMFGHPISMVHRTIANPLVDRWLNALRERAGTRLIRKKHASAGILRALRSHEILVLPFDQNSTRGLGVFVDFFGLAASTNSGIARLALRTGVPVVPAFVVREGRSTHRVHVLPDIQVERSGDSETDVRMNTQRLSDIFEAMVRRHPEQWLWMHKRWKTRPLGEPKLY